MLRRRKWGLVGAGLLVSNLVGCEIGLNATQNKTVDPDVPSTPSMPEDDSPPDSAKPGHMIEPTQMNPVMQAPPPLTQPARGVETQSEVVSASGGQVVTRSAGVNVPEGAVENGVQLTVAEVSAKEIVAPVPVVLTTVAPATAFTPHGTMFEKPVTLSLFYEAKADTNLMVMRLDNENDASWERVPARFVGGVAYFETTHFSVFTVATCGDSGRDPLGLCQDLIQGTKDIDELPGDFLVPFMPPPDFGGDSGGGGIGGSSGSSGSTGSSGATGSSSAGSGGTGGQTGGTTESASSTTGGVVGSTTGSSGQSGTTGGTGTTGGVVGGTTGGSTSTSGGDTNGPSGSEPIDCATLCSSLVGDQVLHDGCMSTCAGQLPPNEDSCVSACDAVKDNAAAYAECTAQCERHDDAPVEQDCVSLCEPVSNDEALHMQCLQQCEGNKQPPPVELPTFSECVSLLLSGGCENGSDDARCSVCAMLVGSCGGAGEDSDEDMIDCDDLAFCIENCSPESTVQNCLPCVQVAAKCFPVPHEEASGGSMDGDGGPAAVEPSSECRDLACATPCASATSPEDASAECIQCMMKCMAPDSPAPMPMDFASDGGTTSGEPGSTCVDSACAELCAGSTPVTASEECTMCMQKCLSMNVEPMVDADGGIPEMPMPTDSPDCHAICEDVCSASMDEVGVDGCTACVQKCMESPGGSGADGGVATGGSNCSDICSIWPDMDSQQYNDCMTKCEGMGEPAPEPTCSQGQRLCGIECIASDAFCLADCLYLLPKCQSAETQDYCEQNPEASVCAACGHVIEACPDLCFSVDGQVRACAEGELERDADGGVDVGGDGPQGACEFDCGQKDICSSAETLAFCEMQPRNPACQYCQYIRTTCTSACEGYFCLSGDCVNTEADCPMLDDPCDSYDLCASAPAQSFCDLNPEDSRCVACESILASCAPVDPCSYYEQCASDEAQTYCQENPTDEKCIGCESVLQRCEPADGPTNPCSYYSMCSSAGALEFCATMPDDQNCKGCAWVLAECEPPSPVAPCPYYEECASDEAQAYCQENPADNVCTWCKNVLETCEPPVPVDPCSSYNKCSFTIPYCAENPSDEWCMGCEKVLAECAVPTTPPDPCEFYETCNSEQGLAFCAENPELEGCATCATVLEQCKPSSGAVAPCADYELCSSVRALTYCEQNPADDNCVACADVIKQCETPTASDPCSYYDDCTTPEAASYCANNTSDPKCQACSEVIRTCPVAEQSDLCSYYDTCTTPEAELYCAEHTSDPKCQACAAVINACAIPSDPQDPPATEEPAPSDGGVTEEPALSDGGVAEELAPSDGGVAEEPAPSDGGVTEERAPSDGGVAEEPAPSDGGVAEEPAPSEPTVVEEPAPSDAGVPAPSDAGVMEEPAPVDAPV